MSARCSSCEASILWAVTVNGKRIPLDEMPDPKGTFWLDETQTPPVAVYARPSDPPGDRFSSHFASCPDAASFRRKP